MWINIEKINNIVINTVEHSIEFAKFISFLDKSPYIRQIAFIGPKIFDNDQFVTILQECEHKHIALIFGELPANLSTDILQALVSTGNVIGVNLIENDPQIEILKKLKTQYNVPIPNICIITPKDKQNKVPQDVFANNSYNFYNLANDLDHIACLKLLQEPMINYDGILFGCWKNHEKMAINAFEIGLDAALNHPFYKKMLKMLRTFNIYPSCPCTRCPIFASLLWDNKKLDICNKISHEP